LALDLRAGTNLLLQEAQRFGHALNAVVDILHVVEPDPDFIGYLKRPVVDNESQEDMIRDSQAAALSAEHLQAQTFAMTLRTNGIRVDHALTVPGPTLPTIIGHARKYGSDLLVLGSHHHGALFRFWYGDTVADSQASAVRGARDTIER